MSGAASRRKGHDYERSVARRLTEATGIEHKRNLTETREGNTGDIESTLPIVHQCKCMKSPSVWTALREAKDAAGNTRHAAAWVKRTSSSKRTEEFVAVPPEDYLEMVGLLVRFGVW